MIFVAVAWLDEREAKAWIGLQSLLRRLDTELARQLTAESELSLSDYEVLVALTAHPDGVRAFALAEMLGWDKTRLSHRVKAMVAENLVTKRPCPIDQRGYFVLPTAKGRRAIEDAAPGHVAAVRRLLIDQLSDHELEVIAEVTERALAALDETPARGRAQTERPRNST